MNPTLNPDETTGEVRLTPRVVLGLAVMLAGLVLALDSLGFVEGGQIFRFWPLILVAIGAVKWASPVPQKMSALIWVLAGVAFLLHTLNRMSFGGVWALLLWSGFSDDSCAIELTTRRENKGSFGNTYANTKAKAQTATSAQ